MESFNVLSSLRFCLTPAMRSMEYNHQNLSQLAQKGGGGKVPWQLIQSGQQNYHFGCELYLILVVKLL